MRQRLSSDSTTRTSRAGTSKSTRPNRANRASAAATVAAATAAVAEAGAGAARAAAATAGKDATKAGFGPPWLFSPSAGGVVSADRALKPGGSDGFEPHGKVDKRNVE